MRIAFFAPVASRDVLDRVGFYATDLRILRELGHDVVIATSFAELPDDVDVYLAWWWTWAFKPLLKARVHRRPLIITGTFDYETPPRGLGHAYVDRPLVQRLLLRLALHGATRNVFVSEFELRQLRERLGAPRATFIPHVVDTDHYSPGTNERERFLFNVAWSGEVNAVRKCLPQIIEGFAQLPRACADLRLKLAGRRGEYHERLVEIATRLGVVDRVDFLGAIEEEEKVALMRRCAVYVQPTLFEGFGVAIAEAMSCGAPVVSSPAGAVTEVVGDAGEMVDGRDPTAISAAIARLLADEPRARRLGELARARIVEHFSYARRRDALGALLDEVARR